MENVYSNDFNDLEKAKFNRILGMTMSRKSLLESAYSFVKKKILENGTDGKLAVSITELYKMYEQGKNEIIKKIKKYNDKNPNKTKKIPSKICRTTFFNYIDILITYELLSKEEGILSIGNDVLSKFEDLNVDMNKIRNKYKANKKCTRNVQKANTKQIENKYETNTKHTGNKYEANKTEVAKTVDMTSVEPCDKMDNININNNMNNNMNVNVDMNIKNDNITNTYMDKTEVAEAPSIDEETTFKFNPSEFISKERKLEVLEGVISELGIKKDSKEKSIYMELVKIVSRDSFTVNKAGEYEAIYALADKIKGQHEEKRQAYKEKYSSHKTTAASNNSNKTYNNYSANKFNNFKSRDYDYNNLENGLLGWNDKEPQAPAQEESTPMETTEQIEEVAAAVEVETIERTAIELEETAIEEIFTYTDSEEDTEKEVIGKMTNAEVGSALIDGVVREYKQVEDRGLSDLNKVMDLFIGHGIQGNDLYYAALSRIMCDYDKMLDNPNDEDFNKAGIIMKHMEWNKNH